MTERERRLAASPRPRIARAALLVLAAAALVAMSAVWRSSFPQDEAAEIPVKAALAVAVVALVAVRELAFGEAPDRPAGSSSRRAGLALALAALLAAVGYVNFGRFHGRTFIHHWEQFHYALGAKYFPELGYDGLYAASIEAQRERDPGAVLYRSYRDLRTNEVVATESAEAFAHRREVVARFSPERWRRFVDDHDFFVRNNTFEYLAQIRLDHGFNPPPSWTFVARLFAARPRIDGDALAAYATLDLLLLAAMFVAVARTFGARIGLLALAVFGIDYAGRYFWVGGAFLREDWLAAAVFGICLLERKRFRWAGAAFGYAAAVRIFPVLFLAGPAVLALRALSRRAARAEDRSAGRQEGFGWALNLGLGFALALALAAGAGSLTGRGPAAWGEFSDHIAQHSRTWLTNNVGLANTILYDRATFRRDLVDFSLPEPWIHWQAKMDGLRHARRPAILLAQALLLLLFGAAAWRLDPPRAAALGIVPIFALVLTTCYYWQMLALVPIARSRTLLWGTLGVNFGLYALHFATPSFEMRYGLMSWGLLAVFVAALAPEALRTWRESRSSSEPGEPVEERRPGRRRPGRVRHRG